MSTLLTQYTVKRVDLVDVGACLDAESGDGAHVVLWKRKEGKPMAEEIITAAENENDEEQLVDEALDDVAALVDALSDESTEVAKSGRKISADRLSKLKSIHDTLTGIIGETDVAPDDPTGAVEKFMRTGDASAVAKALGGDNPVLVEILKSLRERTTTAETVAKAEKDQRVLREIADTLDTYGNLSLNREKDTAVFKRLRETVSADDYARVHEILKGANALTTASFRAVGSDDTAVVDADGAMAEIEKRASERVSKGVNKTHAEAIAAVAAEHPELYRRHRDELIARGRGE